MDKDLPAMVMAHSAALPTQPNMYKMISRHENGAEQKDRNDDWKKMQNIRVICRFRPANRVEKEDQKKRKYFNNEPELHDGGLITMSFDQQTQHRMRTSMNVTKSGKLTKKSKDRNTWKGVVDHVFNTTTDQRAVFKVIGVPLIDAALGGFNATLFAYGQTGSGKTYSMFGANDDGSGTDTNAMGLIPRSFVYLFDRLEGDQSSGEVADYWVSIQMIQLYNGTLMDLLNPNSKTKLAIKTDFDNNHVYVQHLRKIDITSAREALAVLIEGSKNRIVAGHKLNAHSSRSHMLVILKIKQKKSDGSVMMSNINFGDLAGSEDIAKAHGKGGHKGMSDAARRKREDNIREGININKELTALTAAINALVKGRHPSYRSSALTHILQDSLGGNSKTTLLVCASPHLYNRAETIRTLRFAQTAKKVKNKAKINKSLSLTALKKRIKQLEAENAQLKSQLTLERGKMKNITGRRSVVNLVTSMENDSNGQEPSYNKFTGANMSSRSGLGYQTKMLFPQTAGISGSARDRSASLRSQQSGDDHSRQRSVSQTLERLLANRGSDDGDNHDADVNEVDDIQALTTAVSIAEHTLVTESQEYMQQIKELRDKLKEENETNRELEEKSQEQIKEINIAETTISHLRRENQMNAVQVHEKTKELEELQKKLALMEFQMKDYKRTFPNHRPAKPPKDMNLLLVDDSSDIGASDDEDNMLSVPGNDNKQKKDSMDIQLESLQNYLSSLPGTVDLTGFKEELSTTVGVLPELQSEITNKFEQSEKFFGRLDNKTNRMEAQIQSIQKMLQTLTEDYREDKENRGKLHPLTLHGASTDQSDGEDRSDTYGISDGDNDAQRQTTRVRGHRSETFHVIQNSGASSTRNRSQEIEEEIIQSEPSCWSSVFFCGQKNDTDKKEEKKIKNSNKRAAKNSSSGSNELQQSRSLLEYDEDAPYDDDYNDSHFVMRINSGSYGDDTPISQSNGGHRYQGSRGKRSRNGGNNKKRKKKKKHRSRNQNLTVTSNGSYE